MNLLLSAASLLIVMLASLFYASFSDTPYFESFVIIALGYIIIRNAQNDLKK